MNAGLYLCVEFSWQSQLPGQLQVKELRLDHKGATTSHTTLMRSDRARSIHIVDSNLTSSAIEQTRKELLLRTCANGFPFYRYGHQSTTSASDRSQSTAT